MELARSDGSCVKMLPVDLNAVLIATGSPPSARR